MYRWITQGKYVQSCIFQCKLSVSQKLLLYFLFDSVTSVVSEYFPANFCRACLRSFLIGLLKSYRLLIGSNCFFILLDCAQVILNEFSFVSIRKLFFCLQRNNIFINRYRSLYLQEAKDKFKGWVSQPWYDSSVEISYKKVKDGYPLRLWRCVVEVNASPEDIVRRILYER